MRLRTWQWLLAASLALAPASGQSIKPNFSGTWKLNFGKSTADNPPDPYLETIAQTAKTITVATKAEGVTNLLDGTFAISLKPRIEKTGDKYRYSGAHWEATTLVFEIRDQDSKKDTAKTVFYVRESWTLSPDGKVLTEFRRTAEAGKPVVDRKYVFDKQ